MPWTVDTNGDRKYRVSIYAKEELPTWDELYNVFWMNRRFIFDPDSLEGQEMDPYWMIPRGKVILATVCNQLNKILFEDKKRQDVLEYIRKTQHFFDAATDIRYTLVQSGDDIPKCWSEYTASINLDTESPPPIYTIPHPSGNPNPFIIDKGVPRIDITQLEGRLMLCPHIIGKSTISMEPKADKVYYFPMSDDIRQVGDLKDITRFVIKDIIEYFESGVGWKDADGNLIQSDPMKPICPSGYDPAL